MNKPQTHTLWQRVVAIDGPSGAGKSTCAERLARELGAIHIDTGAMYRALGIYLFEQKVDFKREEDLKKALEKVQIEYAPRADCLIEINGEDLTERIREHHVSAWASQVSRLPLLRQFLTDFQRTLPGRTLCVMEGRDIGTVVFPQAFAKFFLTAELKERAKRRAQELSKGESEVDSEQVLKDVQARDQRDSERNEAPLIKAADAYEIDTTDLGLDQVVTKVREITQSKAKEKGLMI